MSDEIEGSLKPTPPTPSHVYEGKPDARQSDRVDEPVSRFRPRYRALTAEQKQLHDEIKEKAAELEMLYRHAVEQEASESSHKTAPLVGRYHALALTSLEQSVMWIIKGLTS